MKKIKDERLSIRMNEDLLKSFKGACDLTKTKAPDVLRELIKTFNLSDEFRSHIVNQCNYQEFILHKRQESKKEYNARRQKEYRNKNELNKLKHALKVRTYIAFKQKRYNKNSKTEEILGASYEIVKVHIESQFKEGMSWGNRSLWHIDHRTPLASAKSEEEVIKLCHYTNLQPLWADENIKKSDKMPWEVKF